MNAQNATTSNTHTNLISVGDLDFEEKVLKSTTPVIVDFWADWCSHCHALAPIYEKLSSEYTGKLLFAKLNGEDHPFTPPRYGIRGFPTLLIFNDGREIGRLVGPHPARLQRAIEGILAKVARVDP